MCCGSETPFTEAGSASSDCGISPSLLPSSATAIPFALLKLFNESFDRVGESAY